MGFSFEVEAFDVENVLFFLLGSDFNTYCIRIVALSPFLSTMALKIFLVVLDLFLMSRKCLLPIRYVNRGDINGFIFPEVLIFLFC